MVVVSIGRGDGFLEDLELRRKKKDIMNWSVVVNKKERERESLTAGLLVTPLTPEEMRGMRSETGRQRLSYQGL